MHAVIDSFYPNTSGGARRRKQQQISKWKQQRQFIEDQCSRGNGKQNNFRSMGTGAVLPNESEALIVLWVSTMRRDGCPISAQMLHYKAL
jgi:hypothetical protein